jgi:hypothetical protein
MFRDFVDRSKKLLLFCSAAFFACLLAFTAPSACAQANQGAIAGVVQITGPKTFQNSTPDSRFLQISAKYVF